MDLLIASLAALLVGPLLVRATGGRPVVTATLDGFVMIALSGLVLLMILPHSLAAAGGWALLALSAGVLAPTLFERLSFIASSVADRHQMVIVPALAGLALHAFTDGAALATAQVHTHGDPVGGEAYLAMGVLLHRVPLGLVIWSRAAGRVGVLLLALMGAATVVGFWAGGAGLELVSLRGVGLFEAFVAGSLLHVAFASPSHSGEHLPEDQRTASGVGALVAAASVVALVFLHPLDRVAGGLDRVLGSFGDLALESAPALLLGFVGAGALQALLPAQTVRWLRSRTRAGEAIKGMTFGLPLPLCSCGVLPVYRSMVTAGAPTSAALAFLLATPEIGVDAFLLSLPLLGTDLAVTRLLCAAVVAVVAAIVLYRLAEHRTPPVPDASSGAEVRAPALERLREAFQFAGVELFDHTMPWILLGLAIAAVMVPVVDAEWLSDLPAGADVVVLAILGVPGYVCASGATPMVAVLIAKGLSPGAAIAFLITGPATNVTTIGVLAQLHGRRLAIGFAIVVPSLAIGLGLAVNALGVGTSSGAEGALQSHEHSPVQMASVAILAMLLVWSLLRRGPRGLLGEVLPQLDDHVHEHDGEAPAH